MNVERKANNQASTSQFCFCTSIQKESGASNRIHGQKNLFRYMRSKEPEEMMIANGSRICHKVVK